MIAFVILHYQAIEETKDCISSILELEGEKKIIVVDNDSPNKSGRLLKEAYSNIEDVEVIISDVNNGFAAGNNIGYAYARQLNDVKYIVVMNNDMIIKQKDFIEKIEEVYLDTEFDILGPDIFSVKYEYHQNPQATRNLTLGELRKKRRILIIKKALKPLYFLRWKIFGNIIKKREPDYSRKKFETETIYDVPLHGSCYIFSESFILKNERCFDEGTFMYLESYILFYLAKQRNERIVYDPRISLFHLEDIATDKTIKNNYKKAIFSIDNLLKSTNYFIKLIESNGREEISQ